MKIVKEVESRSGNYYEVTVNDILIKTIRITRIKRERNNFVYFILIDSEGRVIEDVYKFINQHCREETINGREQMINALKLLYSYKEIREKEFEELDGTDLKLLSNLILGIGTTGMNEEQQYLSSRGSNTHDIYFYNIRKYFKFLDIDNKYLFEQRTAYKVKGGYGMLGHTQKMTVKAYTNTKSKGNRDRKSVPKYIRFNEYISIIKYINDLNDPNSLRNRIIIDLMFTTGMRLGEVLGLTLEDIKDNIEDSSYGTVYIRNRVSDKQYQKAKTCLKVYDPSIYKTRSYNTKHEGYQTVSISSELYELIKEYIDESRSILEVTDKVMDNILRDAKADSVEDKKDNYYLFLNKNGGPLSSSGWNKFLKKAFLTNDIAIDIGTKKNSLSHRFRHGFAMYLIKEKNKSIEYVRDEMRHTSLQSTLIYYNPTEEERLKNIVLIEESMKNRLKEE